MSSTQQIWAIYEKGALRLLDPESIGLNEGERVRVVIDAVKEEPSLDEIDTRLARAGLLATIDVPENVEPLSEAESNRLAHLFADERLTSDLIDEDKSTV